MDSKRQKMFLGHNISGKGTVDTIFIPTQTDITCISPNPPPGANPYPFHEQNEINTTYALILLEPQPPTWKIKKEKSLNPEINHELNTKE
jgi:hypothetical protein